MKKIMLISALLLSSGLYAQNKEDDRWWLIGLEKSNNTPVYLDLRTARTGKTPSYWIKYTVGVCDPKEKNNCFSILYYQFDCKKKQATAYRYTTIDMLTQEVLSSGTYKAPAPITNKEKNFPNIVGSLLCNDLNNMIP